MKEVSYFSEFLLGEMFSFDLESIEFILWWLREGLRSEPWIVPVRLKGSIIRPFSSYFSSPPFFVTVDSTMDWKPAPKPAYFYFRLPSLTGKTDQFLFLSSFPSKSPRSFEHEIHLICFAVSKAYLSFSSSPRTMTRRELSLFSIKIRAFLVYILFAMTLETFWNPNSVTLRIISSNLSKSLMLALALNLFFMSVIYSVVRWPI